MGCRVACPSSAILLFLDSSTLEHSTQPATYSHGILRRGHDVGSPASTNLFALKCSLQARMHALPERCGAFDTGHNSMHPTLQRLSTVYFF
jgi:hypothetical protein